MGNFEKVFAKLKHLSEDFIVEEIGDSWRCSVSKNLLFGQKPVIEGFDLDSQRDFLCFELEKKDLDHFSMVNELANLLGIHKMDIGYAGSKDKKAWTVQRISLFKPDIQKIKDFYHSNIYLKNFKWSKRKIKIGYLEGNHFKLVLRDVDSKDAIKVVNQIRKIKWFPNYFGKQRFGVTDSNVRIGILILKKKFNEAAHELLRDSKAGTNVKLDVDGLRYLKSLERKNLLMIINSVQSRFFNSVLEMALDEGLDFTKDGMKNCLLPGYKSKFYNGRLGEIERVVLKEIGLTLEDFDIKEMSFLRMKGSFRSAITEVKDLNLEILDDELFKGSKKIILEFTLPSGVYATTFLENFFEFE